MKALLLALTAGLAACAFAQRPEGWRAHNGEPMSFTADRIAVDNVTKAAVASGHVHAVSGVYSLRSEMLSRDAQGIIRFADPTVATTCTNAVGHQHWNVRGEIEYQTDDHVLLRNCLVNFYEMPIFYLPYFWYPLGTDNGITMMPGWTSEWGAYLMTRFSYHLLGDSAHGDDTRWLKAATRFDVREKQGVALGQNLDWNLGDLGRGYFKAYYAWDRSDQYAADGLYDGDYNYANWGSSVPDNRYALEFAHRWDPTERDAVRIKGTYYSDSMFRDDFFRDTFFNITNPFMSYEGNEVAWEHLENAWGAGVSVSGPLNGFWSGVKRLPEVYFDVNPRPVWCLPVNYESQTRVGYLGRQAAEYGRYSRPNYPYAYNPGPWASYDTFRMDTYHRLTAPFRAFNDVVSIVPRLAYRGTFWHQSGATDLRGYDNLPVGDSGGRMYRSIPEAGVTFAARGAGWVNTSWRHMVEPYLDVLAQEASYAGASGARRPYVFDNLDASVIWEDQFAGRGRNLPYSYYGVTPGFRQAWQKTDARGNLRTVVDFDAYAAVQFNSAEWYDACGPSYDADLHKLAVPGSPNYGENDGFVVPGFRLKWHPDEDISLLTRAEYDSERNKVALADVGFQQTVTKDFKYHVTYNVRNSRWWDYSSTPYKNNLSDKTDPDRARMESDNLNRAYLQMIDVGFEQQPLDWFRWCPFCRWDLNERELDCVGAWFDYLVDCLGFRLIVSYKKGYTTIDGYDHREHYNIGFVIFLRALDDGGTNIFTN